MTTEERKKAALGEFNEYISDYHRFTRDTVETIRELLQPTPKKLNALGFEIPESIHDLRRIDAAVGCVVDVFDAARGNPSQDIGGLFSFFFTHSDMHLIRGCLMEHNKLIRVTPQNREADMPDEIWIGFTGDSRFPTYWATGQSLVGNERTKYLRADLANKPALDAEVREAVEYFRERIGDGDMSGREAIKLETLIRAASAVQEEITSKHFTEERKWALNRDVVAFLDILPANGYKIVKERKNGL